MIRQLDLFTDGHGLDPDWADFLEACGDDPVEYAERHRRRAEASRARRLRKDWRGDLLASITGQQPSETRESVPEDGPI